MFILLNRYILPPKRHKNRTNHRPVLLFLAFFVLTTACNVIHQLVHHSHVSFRKLVHKANTHSMAITVMAAVMPHQWAISIKMPASMHNAKRMVTISDNILFILR